MPRKKARSGKSIAGVKDRWMGRAYALQRRLLRVAWIRFLYRVFVEMGHDRADDAAAAISYYAVLSLFPLFLGVIVLLGAFLPGEQVASRIHDSLSRFLPGVTSETISQNIHAVAQFSGALGALSILGLFWSGSQIFGAIGRFMNQAWGIAVYRPFVVRKARDLLLALGTSVLLLASFAATTLSLILRDLPHLASLAGRLAAYSLVFFVFLFSYKFGPNTRVYWRDLWPGTLVASLAFEIFRSLFLVYLSTFANFEAVYGSVASLIVLLVWIYVSALILMFGAEFVSEWARMKRGKKRHPLWPEMQRRSPGSRLL